MNPVIPLHHPLPIAISDYDYDLPAGRIADYPLEERDASKLLTYRNGILSETTFRSIASLLPSDSLMIVNNTRVMEARLLFQKPTGARIEIFCLEHGPGYPDIVLAMQMKQEVTWKCLVGNAAAWTPGLILEKKISGSSAQITLYAELLERRADHFLVRLRWSPGELSFASLLHEAGLIPLPPYIKRKAAPSDAERYQTIYARSTGSVAAPTAGLHFTPAVLQSLAEKNIQREEATLHVGAGTFQPVKTELANDHEMHSEWISLSRSAIERVYDFCNRHITAVGTTSFRTLESLYWIGVQLMAEPGAGDAGELQVQQWIDYRQYPQLSVAASLEATLEWMTKNKLDTLSARTSLMTMPGYPKPLAHALITNFHQPRSTLLLLIAALIGDDWKKAYRYALDHEFRFLSYGDACLLFRP